MYTSIHVLRHRNAPSKFFQASYALTRSASFRHLGEYDRSREWIDKSLAALPGNAEATYNGHLDYLKSGDFKQGYGAYFLAGRALRVMDRPSAPFASWDGHASLQGKTILVCTENGYGDVFVALRFLRRLKSRFNAERILIQSHFAELKPVIERLPCVDQVYGEKDKIPHADYFVSTSLLNFFACDDYDDIPNEPYMTADADLVEKWRARFARPDGNPDAKPGLRVGLRWGGNPKFEGNQYRKFDPNFLFQAVDQRGLNVFSFQRDDDLVTLPVEVTDLAPELINWEETAAALCNLDLLITSCTSIAHLAGALGVETWVCVPTATFHTWAYSSDGVHTPWYKSVRMYRQKNAFYWDEVFENVFQDLRSKLGLEKTIIEITGSEKRFKLSKPFAFPAGRKPLLPYDQFLFNRRFNEAIKERSIPKMLELYQRYPGSIHLNSALSGYFLDQGDFQKGYRGFDLLERSIAPNIRLLPKSNIPEWNGTQDLTGKTIVVASGQGQGADLLVGRFIPRLRELGAKRVIGAVHVHMSDFFAHQKFFDEILLEPDALLTKADYWVRINSLIYLLNEDFESLNGKPYVTPSPARMRTWSSIIRKYQNGKLKVGLRFAGNPQFGANADRVFDPQLLLASAEHPDVQLFSFQRDADIPDLPASVVDLSPDLKSWDDTAAALAHMDLVISSCTSVGHLSAAMGLPTWFCVPHDAYHSWRSPLSSQRKSYWYDSALLFRQTENGSWGPVFDDVKKELQEFVGEAPKKS